MGHTINPIGGRLGNFTFWYGTWPLYGQPSKIFKFLEVSVLIKALINLLLTRLFGIPDKSHRLFFGGKLKKKQKIPNVLQTSMHGLLVDVISNIWGFHHNYLSVFLRIYDILFLPLIFKLLDTFRKFFIERFFRTLKWIRTAIRRRKLPKFGPGGPRVRVLLRWFFYKNLRQPTLRKKFRGFMVNYLRKFKFFCLGRFSMWHRHIIKFTFPFLKQLCYRFNIQKAVILVRLGCATITSQMIARYAMVKIKQGFSLSFVIKNIRRGLAKVLGDRYLGYKLCLAGRFSRKQRATYRWNRNGWVSLNTKFSGIDYAEDAVIGKFGIYGLKLWLFF